MHKHASRERPLFGTSALQAAFLAWFPQLGDIGSRCQQPIQDAIRRGGFMATREAKIIDNAIMGYMQQRRLAEGGLAQTCRCSPSLAGRPSSGGSIRA
jgi:hypothetical protein